MAVLTLSAFEEFWKEGTSFPRSGALSFREPPATVRALTGCQATGGCRMFEVADEWQRFAACRGPYAELFFPPSVPERKEDKLAREANAKEICDECRVRRDCLDYAIAIQEPHGIWGGLNEVERRIKVQVQTTSLLHQAVVSS